MSVNTKAVGVPREQGFAGGNQISESRQSAHYSLLAELPGLIVALMTLVYVVSALWLLG